MRKIHALRREWAAGEEGEQSQKGFETERRERRRSLAVTNLFDNITVDGETWEEEGSAERRKGKERKETGGRSNDFSDLGTVRETGLPWRRDGVGPVGELDTEGFLELSNSTTRKEKEKSQRGIDGEGRSRVSYLRRGVERTA